MSFGKLKKTLRKSIKKLISFKKFLMTYPKPSCFKSFLVLSDTEAIS